MAKDKKLGRFSRIARYAVAGYIFTLVLLSLFINHRDTYEGWDAIQSFVIIFLKYLAYSVVPFFISLGLARIAFHRIIQKQKRLLIQVFLSTVLSLFICFMTSFLTIVIMMLYEELVDFGVSALLSNLIEVVTEILLRSALLGSVGMLFGAPFAISLGLFMGLRNYKQLKK